MPQLEYDDSQYHTGDYKSFSLFVYRSLLSNKAPVLDKLHLNLGPDCPVIDIGIWIDVAVSSHVRELKVDIRSSLEGSVSFPSSLYTSDTLETLVLVNSVLLNVPFSVRLPSLKRMCLKVVDYVDNTFLPSLLSGCPNLEDLYMERHDGDATMDATVVVPSLQRLSMYDINYGTCGRCVIDVPSLKYLDYCSTTFVKLRICPSWSRHVFALIMKLPRSF